MPRSRATARSERFVPSVARWPRAGQVVVGAGRWGGGARTLLAEAGEGAGVVPRGGGGRGRVGGGGVAAAAWAATRMRELPRGAAPLNTGATPPYHRWPTDWPP